MVTVYVDGRPVQVPERTSAAEIRRITHSDQSRPIARASGGKNVIVHGEIDVSEGDRFIVGRPFTKGMQKFRVLSSKKQRKADRSVRIIFPQPLFELMRGAFSVYESASREGYAVARCGIRSDRKNRDYFVRGLHIPAKEDLFEQSSITVTPRAEFIEAVLGEAAVKGDVVVEVHTHVGSREPNFSWIDIENGLENGRFLRSCGLRFAMAVVGEEGFSFCDYDGDHDSLTMPESARISVLGRNGMKDALAHRSASSCELPSAASPGSIRVAVAGLDGIGFRICSMLAHQGVRDFLLLDDGVLGQNEAVPHTKEAGKRRTKAAQNMLRGISPDIEMTNVSDIARSARSSLRECDMIFYCGQDEALKAAVADVSLKYFIPCIEARTVKNVENGGTHGLIRVFLPGITGCGKCSGEPGPAGDNGPASVPINEAVATIAAQELMDMLSGVNRDSDIIEYDPDARSVVRSSMKRDPGCPMCGGDGVLGTGDDRKPRRS
jgi:molybdopterin/thiamine biosynthesis adenylyltransferase